MSQQEPRDAVTGLYPAEMDARDEQVDAWAQRVLRLQEETQCSIRDALRAVEMSDKEQ